MVMTSLLLMAALLAPADERLDQASEFLAKGWYGDAIDLLETMRGEGGGDSAVITRKLAEAHLGDGGVDTALQLLEDLEVDYDVALLLGDAYGVWADQMAWDGASADDVRVTRMDAATHYRNAVELAPPGDSTAVVRLGYLQLYGLNEYVKAIELANGGLDRRPGDGELLLLRGCAMVYDFWNKSQTEGQQADADDAWDQAVDDLLRADEALGGERIEPYGQLIWLYQTKGRSLDAVNAAVKVAERQTVPELESLYNLAKQYSYGRDWPAAARALEAMVATDANDLVRRIRRDENPDEVARELHWAFQVFGNRGDNATAYAILKAITDADPKEPVIWANFAVACENTSNLEEALAAYDKKITLQPEDPRTYNDKATLLNDRLNHDPDETIPLYEKSIAMCEEQLAAADIADEWRSHLNETLRVARGNLDGLKPAPSLLDSVLDRLKAVDKQDDADDEGSTEG